MRPWALLACALLLPALAGGALADRDAGISGASAPGAARFAAASAMRARGNDAGAAAALVALADDLPADPLADDALFAAGQLYEEKLSKPAKAAELYQRIVRDYPDSRVSLGAERRLAHLREQLGPGDRDAAALAAMNDILFGHTDRPESDSIARMEALVARNPDWSGGAEALLWLGSAYAREGRTGDALRALERVATRWPESDEAFQALGRAAELAARAGRFAEADRYVAELKRKTSDADLARVHSYEDSAALVARERLRARLFLAAEITAGVLLLGFLLSIALGAGSMRAGARALARPPIEIIYMAPVAALLWAAALTGYRQIAPAVAIIAGAGVVIAWLHGVAIRLHRRHRLLMAVHTLAAVVGVIAACYFAVHRTRLLDMILATVRFGPEV